MTYTLTFEGGPYDGQTREYDDLGTTWSRMTVKDGDGRTIGFYHYWGPGTEPVQKWISKEDFDAWAADVTKDYTDL